MPRSVGGLLVGLTSVGSGSLVIVMLMLSMIIMIMLAMLVMHMTVIMVVIAVVAMLPLGVVVMPMIIAVFVRGVVAVLAMVVVVPVAQEVGIALIALDGRDPILRDTGLRVDVEALQSLVDAGTIPVISTVATGSDGALYNVNADTAAAAIAVALRASKFVVLTDVPGLYRNWPDTSDLIASIGVTELEAMLRIESVMDKARGAIARSTATARGSEHRATDPGRRRNGPGSRYGRPCRR